ncbi:hypothetical protein [Mesorhizobium sp.]|uniref:hypothetical protein n=1 Tax=Mesorhizobium sp. TaxID=1871066 RepID=UPI00258060D9|nr:hypothetical protein [Mesorhizobium sp.]
MGLDQPFKGNLGRLFLIRANFDSRRLICVGRFALCESGDRDLHAREVETSD